VTQINGKTKLLGVFGYPIEHSRSPVMQNALLKHLQINASYLPFSFLPEHLSDAVQAFRTLGFIGANITIPFKEKIIPFIDELDSLSHFTGSVNTLYWKDGIIGSTLMGTTTDPYGAIFNLQNALGSSFQLDSSVNVALLGNGGAARAIAFVLAQKGVSLTIVSRNQAKGEALVDDLTQATSTKPKTILFQDFESITEKIDLVINATSVGMSPSINETPLLKNQIRSHQIIYDIVYNPPETLFLKEAKAIGCKVIQGTGMLAAQGAASFAKWFPAYSTEENILMNALFMNNALIQDVEIPNV
jgi:shikimate dehydrogenase